MRIRSEKSSKSSLCLVALIVIVSIRAVIRADSMSELKVSVIEYGIQKECRRNRPVCPGSLRASDLFIAFCQLLHSPQCTCVPASASFANRITAPPLVLRAVRLSRNSSLSYNTSNQRFSFINTISILSRNIYVRALFSIALLSASMHLHAVVKCIYKAAKAVKTIFEQRTSY